MDRVGGTGISRTTIRGYEVGMYKPGTRELRLLSEALEVTPTWLIFGAPEEAVAGGRDGIKVEASPVTELQKFLMALPLLHLLEPRERQVVYDVLHSLARMKAGETIYRGHVISMAEVGGLLGDLWADLREGRGPDEQHTKEYVAAFQQHILGRLQTELGPDLDVFLKGAAGAVRKVVDLDSPDIQPRPEAP